MPLDETSTKKTRPVCDVDQQTRFSESNAGGGARRVAVKPSLFTRTQEEDAETDEDREDVAEGRKALEASEGVDTPEGPTT